ncbi:HipA N-terminal domain-containing protein [Gallibacterium salpingitidis]|uniref:HipA N-terminal domain-containing protein n=1 Tax=Gallibacterium salpingitidis TaxID=505341 RepID=UPI00266EBBD9|nr:HipA N-terminal domain-containing protein [Gallibacterium salpingitidis]WKT00738.1 HipA N-terminal domain-containing protein [Gallibacterium salpingitidis]
MLKVPLIVKRELSNGEQIEVGKLAENKQGTFFQYTSEYLARFSDSLAPFNLAADTSLQKAPSLPHFGLHGLFADSLPDGWGLYLMDRIFRQNGYDPKQITALERLAYLSQQGAGSLSYEPALPLVDINEAETIDFITLGKNAIQEFEGTETDILAQLVQASGSGGARPKLNVTQLQNGLFTTDTKQKGTQFIIKLTSKKFPLQQYIRRTKIPTLSSRY